VDLVRPVFGLKESPARRMLAAFRWLALAIFIIALAQPRLVRGETQIKASGVDIVVCIDLSSSMASEDFVEGGHRVNRIDMLKEVLSQFIDHRPNDRIGLVAFAAKAFIASPLTLDHDFLQANLARLHIGLIEDRTAIGSALMAGINRLTDIKSKSKIIILMTDGGNNAGKIAPLQAADVAETMGVKVYTIGIGTRGVAPYPVGKDFNGQTVYRNLPADVEEEPLQAIADKTGGKYYRADTTESWHKIYAEIDKFEKTEVEVKKYEHYDELYRPVGLGGLGLMLLEILLSQTVWRKLP